jgi:hypothetical protein
LNAKAKTYRGYFNPVSGAGAATAAMCYLHIDSYYQGQLFLIPHQATTWLPVDLSMPIQYK